MFDIQSLELKNFDQEVDSLLGELRNITERLASDWEKVPTATWKLAQRYEGSCCYSQVCQWWVWPISVLDRDAWYADFFIDCATGQIIGVEPGVEVEKKLLLIVLENLSLLDPMCVLKKLEIQAERNKYSESDYIWVHNLRGAGGVPEHLDRNTRPLPSRLNTQLVEST